MSDQKKNQLHAVLAVEGSLKGAEDKILDEAKKVFKDGNHFNGFTKTYEKMNEEDTEQFPSESKQLVTNVPDKLEYVEQSVIATIDCMYQKEFTNTTAKADLVINGNVIATDVPATVLLNLESKLKKIREVYAVIPTLDSDKVWKEDANGTNVFITEAVETIKSKKKQKPITLVEATDHHPAQAQLISEDVQQGKWKQIYKSGCLSARQKHNLLKKIDELARAVVSARCSANQEEVKNVEIGKKIFEYINGTN
jgi:hypothetical protein